MFVFNSHKTIAVLEKLLPANPIIVEAGAFDGNDTNKMALAWPQGTIHAFEPLPEIFVRLEKNTASKPNVIRHPFALSTSTGTELFYVSEKPTKPGVASQAGSLHKPKERLAVSPLIFPRTAHVNTITLAEWAEQHTISHIDLLWLDTQGHEIAILAASESFLKNIHFILAEVSFIESYEGQPLYDDVVAWMEGKGFEVIGQDFEDREKSFFGNALFCNKIMQKTGSVF